MDGRNEHQRKEEARMAEIIKDLPSVVQDYYYGLSKKSYTTARVYLNHIRKFLSFLEENSKKNKVTNEMLCEVTSDIIDRYQEANKWKKNGKLVSDSAQANRLCALNSFYKFLKKRNYITENPMTPVERPNVKNDKPIVYLTEEEIQRVILEIKLKSKDSPYYYRDLLLFLLPIYTGLRVMAIDEINVNDINLEGCYVKATDKRAKTDDHYFDSSLALLIRKWKIARRALLGTKKCDALFISNKLERMHPNSIRNVIAKYTACIEGKHIRPHKLRATCATQLYESTGDIYLVSKVLGHDSTVPTSRYAAVNKDKIKGAASIIGEKINF